MILALLLSINSAQAYLMPDYFIARWKLINPNLTPKIWQFNFNLSFWDYQAHGSWTKLWEENQVISLENNWSFELSIGSNNPIPGDFTFESYKYLQIMAWALTQTQALVLLDPFPTNSTKDRIDLLTLPFKAKSENLYWRIPGYSGWNLPYLDNDWKLPDSTTQNIVTTTLTSLQSQIDAISTTIGSWTWKDPVQNLGDLPINSVRIWEVRYVINQNDLRVFSGTSWTTIWTGGTEISSNSLSYDELKVININRTAQKWFFYWDSDNLTYYIWNSKWKLEWLVSDSYLPVYNYNQWLDFRNTDLSSHIIDRSNWLVIGTWAYGLYVSSTDTLWRNWIAFPEIFFNNNIWVKVEIVFYTGANTDEFMFGLINSENQMLWVDTMNDFWANPVFRMAPNWWAQLIVRDWNDLDKRINLNSRKITLDALTYYKVVFDIPNISGDVYLYKVSSSNWDAIITTLLTYHITTFEVNSWFSKLALFPWPAQDFYLSWVKIKN